jgi:cytoskeletal protein RodZ
MDSFGKLLRAAREQKNLSLEDTADQTSISIQYIAALESENVEMFPGEPYAVGFLRNYAEFLELDSAYMISLFRAKRIQEAPTPVELFARRRPAYLIPLIVCIALVVLGGAAFGVWRFILYKPPQGPQGDGFIDPGHEVYNLTNMPFNRRLYIGDELVVPHPNGAITLTVTGTLGELSLQTPVGVQFIELGQERDLDIDGTPGGEIIIFVSDISSSDASRGAEIRALIKTDAGGATDESAPSRSSTMILSDPRGPYPFSVNVSFRASCLLRYQLDGNDRVEKMYANGETFAVSAQNRMSFWVSNYPFVRIRITASGKEYEFDNTRLWRGIAVFNIVWGRDNTGVWHLRVDEVD